MAHCYLQPITVTTTPDGQPTAFIWRGTHYRVEAIYATWHLRDRWWEPATAARPPSDRTYYRIQCPHLAIFELYHDRAGDAWILDRVID